MFLDGIPIYPLSPCWVWKGEYAPVRYDVHPIIKWLSKYLPIDSWIDGVKPLLVDDHADKIYQVGNSFYIGTRALERLKKHYDKKGIKP